MTDRWFVDTNVYVYAVDTRDRRKQRAAQQLLSAERSRLVLSAQVLGEFYVTVTRKLPDPLPPRDAAAAVAGLSVFPAVVLDNRLANAAMATSDAHQLSYWDALIIEAAAAAGCERVLSEDLNDGQTIRGVEIVNPFA